MKINDVKLLWARSGNRCAYNSCRIELAPIGSRSTLGEIAHIVAKSPSGPRGDDSLPMAHRDDYDNLILLCPTHHKLVDDNVVDWPVGRLQKLKQDHEHWVSSQLEKGSISVHAFQGENFLTDRIKKLEAESSGDTWIYSALTPLDIADDSINPQSVEILDIVNKTSLPRNLCVNPIVNVQHTRPNQHGIQNEDIRERNDGNGHRIQVFRNGHAEMSILIEGRSKYITSVYMKNPVLHSDAKKLLHFSNIQESLYSNISYLHKLWQNCFNFYNMELTCAITSTHNSRLIVSSRYASRESLSHPVNNPMLEFNRVFDRSASEDDLLHFSLQRIVESYGWVLPTLRDVDGVLSVPKALM